MKLYRVYEVCYNAGEKISNCVYAAETTKPAADIFRQFCERDSSKIIDPPWYSRKRRMYYATAYNRIDRQPIHYEIFRIW